MGISEPTARRYMWFLSDKAGGYVAFAMKVVVVQLYKAYIKYCANKEQIDKDQEKAQSEKDSHSKNRGGKNLK